MKPSLGRGQNNNKSADPDFLAHRTRPEATSSSPIGIMEGSLPRFLNTSSHLSYGKTQLSLALTRAGANQDKVANHKSVGDL
mmetsp:Transcript_6004/g.15994  ORF Transcript_6004/g.15994 Transcript_6004/m.15994 type:complete len:82 (+) Transcript_6004:716-961(+)